MYLEHMFLGIDEILNVFNPSEGVSVTVLLEGFGPAPALPHD